MKETVPDENIRYVCRDEETVTFLKWEEINRNDIFPACVPCCFHLSEA